MQLHETCLRHFYIHRDIHKSVHHQDRCALWLHFIPVTADIVTCFSDADNDGERLGDWRFDGAEGQCDCAVVPGVSGRTRARCIGGPGRDCDGSFHSGLIENTSA